MNKLPVGSFTHKQIREIERCLYRLELARAFLKRTDVAVAIKGKLATTTLHYTRGDGNTLYEIDKEIGSDLTGFDWGIEHLRWLITPLQEGEPE